jgi:hypothetical protein
MRHRAPRPPIDLRHRLRLGTARLLGEAARLSPGRAVLVLVVLLSLATGAYAALTSVTGGSSNQQAESAGSALSHDGEPQTESSDGEVPDPANGLPASDGPTPSASSSEPNRSGAERRERHNATASATPGDSSPPSTSLSAVYPARDAATFTFSADEAASFSCSLDGAAYTSCSSAMHYTDLAPGWHTFAVRATDTAGNLDPSPAETRWHARDGRSADL